MIHALSEGTRRTGELRRHVADVSEKMLIQTLRRLEQNGLVRRTSYPEVPPRVDDELTELGWSLSSVVTALDRWVEAHAEQMSA